MVYIPHVHIFKGEILPLPEGQAILQKMPVGTSRISLQTGDTVLQLHPVQSPCHRRRQPTVLVALKGCLRQKTAPGLQFFLSIHLIDGKKLRLPLRRQHPLRIFPQLPGQVSRPLLPGCNLFQRAAQLGTCHGQTGKDLFHHLHKVRRTDGLSGAVHLGKGQIESVRGLCHIQVQIKSLYVHLLPGTGRQFQLGFPQKFPIHIRDDSPLGSGFGNVAVIDSQKKQHLDLF